jgi:carboxyl-terminal processing protease
MAEKMSGRIKEILAKKRLWALVLVVAVAAAVSFSGRLSIPEVSAGDDRYEKLKVFTEVLSVVEHNYVEEVETENLVYSAIKGLMGSLDPHSGFLTPEAYKEMQVDTKGEFGGLGIQISIKDGVLTIIAPIEDTPAWRAGLQAGDKILRIEDEPTKDMTIHDAVSKMRGPKGTEVTISISREGMKGLKDYTITRDIIKIKSIKSKVLEGNIGYIKVTQFQQRTSHELSKALRKLMREDISALILDLRNNPGGLLTSAVDVTGKFLPKGRMVVYIKGRDGDKTEYRTSGRDLVYEMPMVVLVNQGSASASEIVAGALKDWKRAVVLGVTTFGKGSVQSVIPLSDGSGLRLTTSRYYTPKGTSIQSTGIAPDITVKLAAGEGKTPHPVIREKDLERHLKNDQGGEEKPDKEDTAIIAPVSEEEDAQLQRAIDLLKTWTIFKDIAEEPEQNEPEQEESKEDEPEDVPVNP